MGCLCEQIATKDQWLSPVCIGNLWIFENLKPLELESLAMAAERKVLSSQEAIFYQGDKADSIVLIKSGRIKLSKVLENGVEIILDYRKAGDFIGENMLSEETDYPMTAWCLEQTLTCGFTKRKFESIVLEHPNIGLQVIRNLSRRITLLTDHVGSMAFSNLEQRLYRVLVNVAREHGEKQANGFIIRFPLTHEDLSFLVGAHRVSITRALKSLKESGKVAGKGQSLFIPSLAA
jgi:CRP/FNR family transcriptional regulator, cyclic AMP receptor protein